MPLQSLMSREAISASQQRVPLRASALANIEHPPKSHTVRGNGLLDKPPAILNTKRQHQPTEALRELAAENEKKKAAAELRARNKAALIALAAVKASNAAPPQDDPDDDDSDEDPMNISPSRRQRMTLGSTAMDEDVGAYYDTPQDPEEIAEIQMDLFADEQLEDVTTPSRVTKVTMTEIAPRKVNMTKKKQTDDKLEEKNLQRLQARRKSQASQPPQGLPAPTASTKIITPPNGGAMIRFPMRRDVPALTNPPRKLPTSAICTQSSPGGVPTMVTQAPKRVRSMSMEGAVSNAPNKVRRLTLPDFDVDDDAEEQDPDNAPAANAADAAAAAAPAASAQEATTAPAPAQGPRASKSKKVRIEDIELDLQVPMLWAAVVYMCKIATETPFPDWEGDFTMRVDSIEEAFALFQAKTDNITKEQLRYISYRAATLRGRIKARAADHTAAEYGFKRGSTKKIKKHNMELAALLKTDYLFTYKSYEVLEELDENGNPIIDKFSLFGNDLFVTILAEVFFKTKNAIGFRFPDYFEHVSLPLFALVATAIHCSIDEFESGVYQKKAMSFSAYGTTYLEHLAALEEWKDDVDVDGCERVAQLQAGLMGEAKRYFAPVVVKPPPTKGRRIPREDTAKDKAQYLLWCEVGDGQNDDDDDDEVVEMDGEVGGDVSGEKGDASGEKGDAEEE